VILNLLGNAIKFTGAGGQIRIVARHHERSAEVQIIDTGVGIPEDRHDTIFDKFEQVGSASARQGGTGLGLAIARHIVESHGGELRVESEVGVGSTFSFTLPDRVVTTDEVLPEAA
jgi:signal transduction histidine kinase